MKVLQTAVFDKASELVDFVNNRKIQKEDIQEITHTYRIYYWEEKSILDE